MVSDYLSGLYSLSGRVALVTGGSSGIGAAIAEALGRAGASVVLVARREQGLLEVAGRLEELGCDVGWVAADVGDRADVERLAVECTAPDILVNSAGVNLRPPFDELAVEDWDRTLEVNLTAPFLLGRAFGPGMAERGWGRIINIASQQSIRAFGNSGAYGVSKAGIAALTRSQAEIWSSRGVSCNAIAPGFVETPLTAPVFNDPARASAMAARTMSGRNGRLSDLPGLAVLLAGPGADYITGQTIFIDGGLSVGLAQVRRVAELCDRTLRRRSVRSTARGPRRTPESRCGMPGLSPLQERRADRLRCRRSARAGAAPG